MDPTVQARPSGLKTALDTIVAPNDAFERLRSAPTWGWAFLLTLVLYAAGTYLMQPAVVHATQSDWPNVVAANPRLAQLTAEQQQHYLDFILRIIAFNWLFAIVILPIVLFIQTIVMLVLNVIGRGAASFGSLWAAAANSALPSLGLGAIVTAILVVLRGPDSFERALDVQTAMPSLALLAPGAPLKLHAFLAAFTPFSLWGCFLIATAMVVIGRVSRAVAWTTGILLLLIGGGFFALGAR
jgi:Yip1 domain